MGDHESHKKVFLKVFVINIIVFLAEFAMALYSGSLMMLSDSFHVLIHIIASLVGFVSEFEFLGLAPGKIKTGTAFINIALFFISAGIIAKEAVERLSDPPELVLNSPYFMIAVLGLVANIYSAKIIDRVKHGECSQNMETLHACMIYDAASSVTVIVGALAIRSTEIYIGDFALYLDPVLSIALVLLMVRRGWKLLKNTLKPTLNV